MEICVVIDYGSGNLRSAAKAFERAAAEAGLNLEVAVSGDPTLIGRADRLVLPGVGAYADCRRGLDAVDGLAETLERRVLRDGIPFLGICVGMQLMATRGLEHGETRGLGWLAGDVVPLQGEALRIPHMGWNELAFTKSHPVFAGIQAGAHAYFVHSYQFQAPEPSILATVDYGGPVVAAVGCDNMVGTQFHPEKSQETGLRLIANFLGWRP
jgi:glutamine amidotransferase